MKMPNLERLGLPGVAGLGLLLFALSFYLGNVAPVQAEVAKLRADKAQLAAATAPPAGAAPAAGGAAAPSLPTLRTAPELLLQLNAAATRYSVTADRATYEIKTKDGQRRLQVGLPVTAPYPSLRAYLRDALALAPGASLDELHMSRPQATDPAVLATMTLSYALSSAP